MKVSRWDYWNRDRTKDHLMKTAITPLPRAPARKPPAAPAAQRVLFEVDVETFLGLTEWKPTHPTPPPCNGWWKTRSITSPEILQPQRRWWDGRKWSMPVVVGKTCDNLVMEKRYEPSLLDPERIEWCGLKACPGGYLPENGYKRALYPDA